MRVKRSGRGEFGDERGRRDESLRSGRGVCGDERGRRDESEEFGEGRIR